MVVVADAFPFVDSEGRRWGVVDFRVAGDRKMRVPIGDWRAEARAFIPDDADAPVIHYRFGLVVYRTTAPKILADQLRFAKPMPPRRIP